MTRHPPLRQKLEPGLQIARHRHDEAYVAVVLAGGYAEAGDNGRRRLTAGDVVVHPMFSRHLNHVAGSGAVVLNLSVAGLAAPFGRLDDPDAVARTARRAIPSRRRPWCGRCFRPCPRRLSTGPTNWRPP